MKERLVAAPLILSVHLPKSIRQNYPGVCVKLTIANTAQVVQAVLEGSAELGCRYGAAYPDPLIAVQ